MSKVYGLWSRRAPRASHHPLNQLILAHVEEAPGDHEGEKGQEGGNEIGFGMVKRPIKNHIPAGTDQIGQGVPFVDGQERHTGA